MVSFTRAIAANEPMTSIIGPMPNPPLVISTERGSLGAGPVKGAMALNAARIGMPVAAIATGSTPWRTRSRAALPRGTQKRSTPGSAQNAWAP
jgi:hypothetical protein